MSQSCLTQVIPASKIDAVQKALQSAFPGRSVDDITVLAGGLSSALVYRIVADGTPYVLRLVMQVSPFNDPARQYACMQIAANGGIAPPVIYANADDAVSITGFIDAQPIADHFTTPFERAAAMAALARSIHALPPFPKLVSYLDGIDMFIENVKGFGLLPESATAEHFALYAEIQRAYPRHDPDAVSSHNDLNPNNILFDGNRFWVIDWEAAFLSDRYVDLATIGRTMPSDAALEDHFLRAYFGDALDEYKRARYFLMQQVCHVFYSLAFMAMVAGRGSAGTPVDPSMETPRLAEFHRLIGSGTLSLGDPETQLTYAKVSLNEALHNMRTPRFAESIALMG